jgi:hypothetical protein
MTMARSATILAATIVMALFSPAYAQTGAPPEGPGVEGPSDKVCVFAGESYSPGASICVTSHAGITCGTDGRWAPASSPVFDPANCQGPASERSQYRDNENYEAEETPMRHHCQGPASERSQYRDNENYEEEETPMRHH